MNLITENNDIGLVEFFKYLNQVTDMFVTCIEVAPIRIKKDMYITGFRRIGLSFIEAHVKHIKQLMIKTNEFSMEMPLKETAEEEMWIDTDLLAPGIVRGAFNDLRNYFFQLKGFEIAQIQYKLKSEPDNLCSQEEVIIYDNKRIACKETIAKRKLCTLFKSHFSNFGENAIDGNKQYKKALTDEEIAEMA
jgi:hypothetical protein